MFFSAAYKGRKDAIPPKVAVIKNNKIDGLIADFSNTSNRATFVLSGDRSTFLNLIFNESKKAIKPNAAQIKKNHWKLIFPANVKPKAGPIAKAKLPDKP